MSLEVQAPMMGGVAAAAPAAAMGAPQPGNVVQNASQGINQTTQELLKKVIGQAMQQSAPGRTHLQAPQPKQVGGGPQLAGIAGIVQQAVQAHKQKQINVAVNDWQGLQAAHERAEMMAGDPSTMSPEDFQKKVMQIMQQDPLVKAIVEDPKKMKNMAKAFQVDWLNPEKTTPYKQGLEKAMKLDEAKGKMHKAMEKMHLAKKPQPQMDQQGKEQMGKELLGKVEGMRTPNQPDPKNIDAIARVLESQGAHEESLEFRRQAHLDSLNMQKENLQQRYDAMQQRAQDQKMNLQERAQWHQEMAGLRREWLNIEAEKALTANDASGLKQAVERGFPIDKLPAKDRAEVTKLFSAEGKKTPVPFNTAEQTAMDDASTQIAKTRAWKTQLEAMSPDGKMANNSFAMFKDRLKYFTGNDTPEASIISDFSRERWAAIGGLVKGVRRGDILKDMVQHTPDPWKDSVKLMHTKLEALEANYALARATTLKEHGYSVDPDTGNDLDADIKSYENHLKTAKEDAKTDKWEVVK